MLFQKIKEGGRVAGAAVGLGAWQEEEELGKYLKAECMSWV